MFVAPNPSAEPTMTTIAVSSRLPRSAKGASASSVSTPRTETPDATLRSSSLCAGAPTPRSAMPQPIAATPASSARLARSPSTRAPIASSTTSPADSAGTTTTNGACAKATIWNPTPTPPSTRPATQRRRRASRATSRSRRPSSAGASRASSAWRALPTLKRAPAPSAASSPNRCTWDLAGRRAELARLALRADPDDVPDEPEPLHRRDYDGRRVELPAPEPVARGRREGVVVVVPRLAERERREPGEVARLVVRLVAPAPEEVAQRVDAERQLVAEEDPHRAAPEHRREPAGHRAGERDAEPERERDPRGDPEQQ